MWITFFPLISLVCSIWFVLFCYSLLYRFFSLCFWAFIYLFLPFGSRCCCRCCYCLLFSIFPNTKTVVCLCIGFTFGSHTFCKKVFAVFFSLPFCFSLRSRCPVYAFFSLHFGLLSCSHKIGLLFVFLCFFPYLVLQFQCVVCVRV